MTDGEVSSFKLVVYIQTGMDRESLRQLIQAWAEAQAKGRQPYLVCDNLYISPVAGVPEQQHLSAAHVGGVSNLKGHNLQVTMEQLARAINPRGEARGSIGAYDFAIEPQTAGRR